MREVRASAETCEPDGTREFRRLWAAVLVQAIYDACDGSEGAKIWIRSDDESIGSFVWICDHLDKGHTRLRRAIFAWFARPDQRLRMAS